MEKATVEAEGIEIFVSGSRLICSGKNCTKNWYETAVNWVNHQTVILQWFHTSFRDQLLGKTT